MLLDRTDQAISSTELQKNTKVLLDRLGAGIQDRYVVIRDNHPMAVLLPIDRYETLMSELDDLRIEAIARERLATLDRHTLLAHEDMLARIKTEVILSRRPATWDEFFLALKEANIPADFLSAQERHLGEQTRDPFAGYSE